MTPYDRGQKAEGLGGSKTAVGVDATGAGTAMLVRRN